MAIQKITAKIIADGAIIATDIADGSITTAKIADANVTAAKLATGAALPSQSGNTNYYLTTDGTNSVWKAQTALAVANTQITGLITSGQIASNITLSGNTTIPTINLTSGQIIFPATQNPSSDANTLDDYEEGTFTPGVGTTGTAPSLTYADRQGYYVRIGKMVYISYKVEVATVSSQGSGNLNLTGLPFTAANATAAGNSAVAVGYVASFAGSQTATNAMVFQGTTYIRPYYMTSLAANKQDCTSAAIANNMVIYMAGCYYTDS